ncbi:MAG: GNAT family N-acetyltransferase, partial [Bacteroidetes bacterium]|nr:GNAT family N-acetyltransferase [Fibrella sp.]
MTIRLLPRQRINATAWDACVAASPHRIVYGYSWYLDAVTSLPDWSWAGLVVMDGCTDYQTVIPVPLRRKRGRWVVHQPLFCQFLAIYSRDENADPTPFFEVMQQRFHYGSVLNCQQIPNTPSLRLQTRQLHTHTLSLTSDYESIARNYSRDRTLNLRRAEAAHWQVVNSDDPEPLIYLFRENHAADIPNGVAPWAYVLFGRLFAELQKRGLITLRYALNGGVVHAGALFVRDRNRLIYLFNAASDAGRRGNARTLLIDQIIRDNAGSHGLVFDFESPEKPSVVQFYESFGAMAEPF